MNELIIRSLATATEAANTLLAEVAHLRAQLAAAYQENEALVEQHNEMDAQLAAAPLDALRVTVELARVTLLHRTDRGVSTDAAAVAAAARWVQEQEEGQP